MQPRHIASKWKKTAALLKFEHLRGYVPKTVIMTESSLKQMLDEYKMVYVKPDVGTFGSGVMRAEALADGEYRYQLGLNAKTFADYSAMYRDIVNATRKRKYLVQKGIHLLQYKGRRFDIRVMVQHNPQKQWETTAVIGRVSAPKKVVTNYHNGGTPKPVELLMEPLMSASRKRQFIRELHEMGVRVAKGIGKSYPGIREIGIDVGVDREFKPWILEVNTFPDPYIFRKLPDKSIVRKVIRYAIAYGRIKPRKQMVKPTKGTLLGGSFKRADTGGKAAASRETDAKSANTQRPAAGSRSSSDKQKNAKTTNGSKNTAPNQAKSSSKTASKSPQSTDNPAPDSSQTTSRRNTQKSNSQPAQGAATESKPAQSDTPALQPAQVSKAKPKRAQSVNSNAQTAKAKTAKK